MAAAPRCLRLCLRSCRQTPAVRSAPRQAIAQFRSLSSTAYRQRPTKGNSDERYTGEWVGGENAPFDEVNLDTLDEEEKPDFLKRGAPEPTEKDLDAMLERLEVEVEDQAKRVTTNYSHRRFDRSINDLDRAMAGVSRVERPKKDSFWNEEEDDHEMITNEENEDEFDEDDILSMAHGKLEEMREHRHYARLAMWEMPLLAKLAKPFEPPKDGAVLRFRYTTYMGEFHPAEKKVVVEFCPRDLSLTQQQQMKLAKLVGPRYNPETEIVRMSCEMFEHQAQNKRYLGDLIDKLIVEAKDPTDTFEDIPLDTRHHTFKTKPKFPREWRMTPQRQDQLAAARHEALLLDEGKKKAGTVIDGKDLVQQSLQAPMNREMQDKVAELVTVPASRGRARQQSFGRR